MPWAARVCKHVSLAQFQSQSTVLDLNKVMFVNHGKGVLAAAVTLSSTIDGQLIWSTPDSNTTTNFQELSHFAFTILGRLTTNKKLFIPWCLVIHCCVKINSQISQHHFSAVGLDHRQTILEA